jgi:hypothetical protein
MVARAFGDRSRFYYDYSHPEDVWPRKLYSREDLEDSASSTPLH